jgi:hypothetical protein
MTSSQNLDLLTKLQSPVSNEQIVASAIQISKNKERANSLLAGITVSSHSSVKDILVS